MFVDTEMLFGETLEYQARVADMLGLTNVQVIKDTDADLHDPAGTLHKTDPNACCSLRKTAPLREALSSFDGWLKDCKRHQSGTRAHLNMFEAEDNSPRIKMNPLALWSAQDTQRFMQDTKLPRHPLAARGYPSIGCAPCKTPVKKVKIPAQIIGAQPKKKNAAFILRTARWCIQE
jgi:phosphoadenosine phosphosulfate reductase